MLQVFVLLPNAAYDQTPSWVHTLSVSREDVRSRLGPYGLDRVAFLRYAISSLLGSLDVRIFSSQDDAEEAPLSPIYYKDLDLNRSSIKGRRKQLTLPARDLTAARDLAICQWTGEDATQICHLIPSRRGERITEKITSDLSQLRPKQDLKVGSREALAYLSMIGHPRNLIYLRDDIHRRWDQAKIAFIPYPNVAYDQDRRPRPYHGVEEILEMSSPSRVYALPLSGARMVEEARLIGPPPHPMTSDLWPQEFMWSYAFASRFGFNFATKEFRLWVRNHQSSVRELDERDSDTDITGTTVSGDRDDLGKDELASPQTPPPHPRPHPATEDQWTSTPTPTMGQVPFRAAAHSMVSADKVSAWSRGLPKDPADFAPTSEEIQ
ncbi:hypothetical protein IE53DRAFT_380564 [Violaceomyces palustris]|uniref:Uncharacterized protein n=1 Tax=Violaceomyces palustris TaxID=1673888 RepID=A0ACD0NUB1_9BASI|nr:hypothetical protein IE53DRAFT_380564 [Violaceomyces palustris]